MNSRLNPSFRILDEFKRYFNLYRSYKVVKPKQFEPDFEEVVGHPSGSWTG